MSGGDPQPVKRKLQHMLQRALGFDRYLYLFARYKVRTLHRDIFEADVLHFARMLPRDAMVLDIGANIGVMTVHLARQVSSGHVHSFEPMPENYAALERVVRHYGLSNVTLHQMALGDADGDLEMVMPVMGSVRMQGLSRVVPAGGDAPDGQHRKVPERRLDDLDFLSGVPVAGIKIDVEDFEQYVFLGGRKLIERWRPLVYTELGQGDNRPACLEFFEDLDYSVCVLEGDRLVSHVEGAHQKHNFFMLPPGHDLG
ncbi:MAG: FkbM family methyltransferase [Actinomycetia bacterium]|nr:FkbM family methyltransferase [Actinomycetes bacterium]